MGNHIFSSATLSVTNSAQEPAPQLDPGLLYNTIVKQILDHSESDSHMDLLPALTHSDGELGDWPDILQSFAFVCRLSSPGGAGRYAVYCPQTHSKALKGDVILLCVMPDSEESRPAKLADALQSVWNALRVSSRDRRKRAKTESFVGPIGVTVLDLALETLKSSFTTHWDSHETLLEVVNIAASAAAEQALKGESIPEGPENDGEDGMEDLFVANEPDENAEERTTTTSARETQEGRRESDEIARSQGSDTETDSEDEASFIFSDGSSDVSSSYSLMHRYESAVERSRLYGRFVRFSAFLKRIRDLLAKSEGFDVGPLVRALVDSYDLEAPVCCEDLRRLAACIEKDVAGQNETSSKFAGAINC